MIKKIQILAIAILFTFCSQAYATNTSENTVKALVVKHSIELGIEPALALSIAKSESKFRHDLRSPYGAVGVFQLMPSTAKKLGVNPYYLSDNIKGGLMYYKAMYQMFGSTELALAAYNAGPVAVRKHNNKVPPYRETRNFVNNIMTEYKYQKTNPDQAIINARRQPPKYNNTITPQTASKPVINSKSVTIKPLSNLKDLIIDEPFNAKNNIMSI